MIVIVWAFLFLCYIFSTENWRVFQREGKDNRFIEFNFTSTCSIKFHLNYLVAPFAPLLSLYIHTHTHTLCKHFMFSNELNMNVVLIRSSTTFLTDLQTIFHILNTNRHLDIFYKVFPCFSTFWINFKISLYFLLLLFWLLLFTQSS